MSILQVRKRRLCNSPLARKCQTKEQTHRVWPHSTRLQPGSGPGPSAGDPWQVSKRRRGLGLSPGPDEKEGRSGQGVGKLRQTLIE